VHELLQTRNSKLQQITRQQQPPWQCSKLKVQLLPEYGPLCMLQSMPRHFPNSAGCALQKRTGDKVSNRKKKQTLTADGWCWCVSCCRC
jgi:hypothetical protein